VCDDDSIFVDRDGEHFGHVLEYMRDGYVSVAEEGARPSLSLLRALKREFGFYCIELVSAQATESEQPEMAYVIGAYSIERYDVSSGQWSSAPKMSTGRDESCACVVAGEIYVSGGWGYGEYNRLSSVEKYTPSSDTWSAVAPMPVGRWKHAAVAMGLDMYVLGGASDGIGDSHGTCSMLKFDSTQSTWSQVAPMPEKQ
jgi:hypothetical protein